jgi:hypothetical protein
MSYYEFLQLKQENVICKSVLTISMVLQVYPFFFYFSLLNYNLGDFSDFINHSCDPNCIIKIPKDKNGKDEVMVIAKRDIDVGEEIVFDYCTVQVSKLLFRINIEYLVPPNLGNGMRLWK